MSEKKTLSITVHGRVQGVFFRDFVKRNALNLGLTGYVRNTPDGTSLEIHAEGEETQLNRLLEYAKKGPSAARVENTEINWSEYTGCFSDFAIIR